MERRDTEINGRQYSMLQPPARQAMPLCTRVAVLLGPVLGTLGAQAQGGGMAVFTASLQNVDPEKVDALMMDAVKASHLCCNGEPVSDPVLFEKHFGEFRGDAYQACLWALWESVRDFLPPQLVSFAQLGAAQMAAGTGSPSPTAGAKTGG